jgi:CubicO group peptidase (beta-lactamase class C family)
MPNQFKASSAAAPEQTPMSDTPLDIAIEYHKYFHVPENRVKIQFPGPEAQYAWQHITQYYPTARAARGGPISNFEVAIDESIGAIEFSGKNDVVRTVNQHFEEMPLDAMIVIKDGKIVYERYKTMTPNTAHIAMSSAKTMSSTLIAMLEDEGKVDISKPITNYIPQLKGSVWDTVLLRHVADMQTGLNATEHDEPTTDSRTNPDQPFYQWMSTLGLVPNTTGTDDPFVSMSKMMRRKPGGEVFEYNSMNPFLLARVVENVENRPFAQVFSDRILSKIGAEHDVYFAIAPAGYALAYGFVGITLRDFARFGMLYTPSASVVSDETILPKSTVKRIQTAGNPKAYAGGYVGGEMGPKFADATGKISNAYMWDAILPDGDLFKAGVGGQGFYVSPSRDMVAVWFTTGDGTEWNEAMGRAIALSFD